MLCWGDVRAPARHGRRWGACGFVGVSARACVRMSVYHLWVALHVRIVRVWMDVWMLATYIAQRAACMYVCV